MIFIFFQVSMQTDIPTCVTLFSLLHYFHLTNFFWMFVEGNLEFYKRDMDIISTSYKVRDSVALNNYKERNIVAQVRHLRRSKMKFNNLKKYTRAKSQKILYLKHAPNILLRVYHYCFVFDRSVSVSVGRENIHWRQYQAETLFNDWLG